MKVKKIFAGMAASAIAMTTFAMGTATTVSAEGAVTGTAGIMFQTNLYTARDQYGKEDWGPVDGPAACVPNPVVGVNGGNGWDTAVSVSDTEIDGDGTYTVSIASSGTINTEPDLSKPANKKGWYVDDNEKLNRMGSPWSMLGSYEPQNEITEETTQEQIEWGIGDDNKATQFNHLLVSTSIPVYFDDDNKCYLDEELKKEVTVSDVTVDLCGTTYTAEAAPFKTDLANLTISIINNYDNESAEAGSAIDPTAFPTQDGTVSITFTIKGLSGESSDSGDSSTGDSSTGDSSASDSSSSSSGSSSSKSNNGGSNNGGSKSGGGSTTTKTTSTSESLGDSASDATENAKSGAPAGIALALAAVAGAVVVVSRKK